MDTPTLLNVPLDTHMSHYFDLVNSLNMLLRFLGSAVLGWYIEDFFGVPSSGLVFFGIGDRVILRSPESI